MFGIAYMLFSGTMTVIAKTRRGIDNIKSKNRAIRNGDLTYYGHNGERLISNDRNVYRSRNNGDNVLVDLYTGEVYKNYSEEKRQIKEKDAINNGRTVIDVGYEELQDFNKNKKDKLKSIIVKPYYRDVSNRNYYIPVYINGLTFYMNIETGLIIRLADKCNPKNKWGNLSIEEIIETVNERQIKLFNIPTNKYDSWWWKDHFYLQNLNYNIIVDNNKTIIEGNLNWDSNMKSLRNKLKEKKVI